MSTEKTDADKAASSSDSSTGDSRPAVQARGNAPAKDGRNTISWTNREGQMVTVPVSGIQSVDEIVPSGTWDVPQRERDDIEGKPCIFMEAIKMNGQNGDYVVVLAAEASTIGVPGKDAELFSVAFSGVPFSKIRRAMGFDEDGRNVGNNRLPMLAKLVKVAKPDATTSTKWYWDLKDPDWTPEVA